MSLSLHSSTAVEILMDAEGGRVRASFFAALAAGRAMWLSSVVVHELATGAIRSARPTHHLALLDGLTERLAIAGFTAGDAIGAARVRADLEQKGEKIGALDALIAGQAIARGWTLVTSDLRRFTRVDGIDIIDWTRSDRPIEKA